MYDILRNSKWTAICDATLLRFPASFDSNFLILAQEVINLSEINGGTVTGGAMTSQALEIVDIFSYYFLQNYNQIATGRTD